MQTNIAYNQTYRITDTNWALIEQAITREEIDLNAYPDAVSTYMFMEQGNRILSNDPASMLSETVPLFTLLFPNIKWVQPIIEPWP